MKLNEQKKADEVIKHMGFGQGYETQERDW